MESADLELRNRTYGLFVHLGRAPTSDEVAEDLDRSREDVRAGWRSLHEEHALVLEPSTGEIRMANPFSAIPTAFRVQAGGRWWYGNCAWDAFGIPAALHVDGHVETSCPDCAEPIAVEVLDRRPSDEGLVFHCLVPAGHWWDDIVFT